MEKGPKFLFDSLHSLNFGFAEEFKNLYVINDEIKKGIKLYKERLYKKDNWKYKKNLRPLYEIKDNNPSNSNYAVWELKYFSKKKINTCNHVGNLIIDRDILSRDEHDIFLAQPKRFSGQREANYYYKKVFPSSCTIRLAELARPRKRKIIETWRTYSKVLSAKHVENLRRLVDGGYLTQVENAVSLWQAEKQYREMQKKITREKAAKIKKQINAKEKERIVEIIYSLFEVMKEFLMTQYKSSYDTNKKSMCYVVLKRLYNLAGYKTPLSPTEDVMEIFHLDLAKNITTWIMKFIENSDFVAQEITEQRSVQQIGKFPCKKRKKIQEYAIDDYIEYETLEKNIEGNIQAEKETDDTEEKFNIEKLQEGQEKEVIGKELINANEEGEAIIEAIEEGEEIIKASVEGEEITEANEEGEDITEANEEGEDITEAYEEGEEITEAYEEGEEITEANEEGEEIIEANEEGAETKEAFGKN